MNADAKCFSAAVERNTKQQNPKLQRSWFLTHRLLPAHCRPVNGSEQPSDSVPVGCFHTTHGTEVLAAGAENSPEAGEALARRRFFPTRTAGNSKPPRPQLTPGWWGARCRVLNQTRFGSVVGCVQPHQYF